MRKVIDALLAIGMKLDQRVYDWGPRILLLLDPVPASDDKVKLVQSLIDCAGQMITINGAEWMLRYRAKGTPYKDKEGFRQALLADELTLVQRTTFTSLEEACAV